MAEPLTTDAVYAAIASRIGAHWASRTVTAGADPVSAERVNDPTWLTRQILGSGSRWGSRDPHVLSVLWWYGASTVIITPALSALAVTGTGLSTAAHELILHVPPDGRLLGAHSTAVAGTGPEAVGANLAANLDPMIGAVAAVGGRPAPLWAITTDAVANQLLWLGRAAGEVERVTGLAGPVVAAMRPTGPLPDPGYVDLPGPHGPRRFVRRRSCCLIYRVPGGAMCTSCPRRPEADRLARLTRLAARI